MLGIATACLSTALGSMFGSARIMQALARDQIFPPLRIFSKGSVHGDEPRRALVLTYLLAQCGLLVGGIDAVAPILTNFFLVTYTLTNAAAALLELSGVPNFRPHWRVYHWGLSLAGAALTLGAMFFLNYVFALITIAIVVSLFVYIYCAFDASRWPDSRRPSPSPPRAPPPRPPPRAGRRQVLAPLRPPPTPRRRRARRSRPAAARLRRRRRPRRLPSPDASSSACLAAGRGAGTDSTAASSAAPAPPAAADAVQLARARLSSRVAAAEAAARATACRHSEPSNPERRTHAPRRCLQLALGAGIGTVRPDTLALPLLAPAADAGDGAGTSAPRRRTTSRRRTPPSTRLSSPTAPPSARTL